LIGKSALPMSPNRCIARSSVISTTCSVKPRPSAESSPI
jgi:hypothetical protein